MSSVYQEEGCAHCCCLGGRSAQMSEHHVWHELEGSTEMPKTAISKRGFPYVHKVLLLHKLMDYFTADSRVPKPLHWNVSQMFQSFCLISLESHLALGIIP